MGTQWIVATAAAALVMPADAAVYLGMLAGTATGLVTKYVLDKRWIFRYHTRDAAHNMQTFALYTLMGVFTTALFWGTELTFFYLIPTEGAHYLGGTIGLVGGYTLKYFLDRRWVFRVETPEFAES